ncbi:hypothetical protein ASE01_20005 [Nocardioides sp. Root190]|uniref:hypothetical protein n=1 Tax=Nocardioides sp. Root190 TaxID=1736488 RepID=UPI0006F6E6D5|nr:hypothetical protein [Nocardioides sp. Root190]KRB73062.1 hypothetical protein ASE01_20005 [Nocardioides sp. Root190]
MRTRHFIGIDPGPIPGIVMLTPRGFETRYDVDVIQCSAHTAPLVLEALLSDNRADLGTAPVVVALERFVIGKTSMKSGGPGAVTRDLVGQLENVARRHEGVSIAKRSAADVKAWATDIRLAHAGLLEPTKGMRHAKDAARHALYAAVKDGGLPDPLSRKAHR